MSQNCPYESNEQLLELDLSLEESDLERLNPRERDGARRRGGGVDAGENSKERD